MSEFGDIEDAVVGVLDGLSDSGGSVFATVRGLAVSDRRQALGAVERWLKPAAAVQVGGREKRVSGEAIAGDARLTVLIAADGLRSTDAPRRGDVDTRGAFALAGFCGGALDGVVVAGDRRLFLLDEQIVGAGERFVALEQRYVAERLVGLAAPTFGGQVLVGSDASVSVTVGALEADAISFAFAGIDGTFRHEMGARPRTIQWIGQMRAADHATLSATESDIEALVGEGLPGTVVDASGRSFDNCVVSSYVRRGPRRIHPLMGSVAQNFELTFVQTAVRG